MHFAGGRELPLINALPSEQAGPFQKLNWTARGSRRRYKAWTRNPCGRIQLDCTCCSPTIHLRAASLFSAAARAADAEAILLHMIGALRFTGTICSPLELQRYKFDETIRTPPGVINRLRSVTRNLTRTKFDCNLEAGTLDRDNFQKNAYYPSIFL